MSACVTSARRSPQSEHTSDHGDQRSRHSQRRRRDVQDAVGRTRAVTLIVASVLALPDHEVQQAPAPLA
jgi:hypothetical protein